MLSGWESGGEEITRANSAQLFVLLSPNEADSPETLKLAIIPQSLAIFQIFPSLLDQTFSQKLNKHPETTAFVVAPTSSTVALSRIPRVLSQSKAPENCARSEGTAQRAKWSVFSMGWNYPGGKDTVVLMVA